MLCIKSAKLVAGVNSIEIGANASVAVEVDTVSVSGGWHLGAEDGKSAGKNKTQNPAAYVFYVGNSATNLPTNLYWGTTSSSPTTWGYRAEGAGCAEQLHFRVPDSFLLGGVSACRFIFHPLGANRETWEPAIPASQMFTFALYANDVKIGEQQTSALSPTPMTFRVPMGVFLDSRECVLKIRNETEPWYEPTDYYYDADDPERAKYKWGCYYWYPIDYFVFEPLALKGMTLIVR